MLCTLKSIRRLRVARATNFDGVNRASAASFDLSRYPLPLWVACV